MTDINALIEHYRTRMRLGDWDIRYDPTWDKGKEVTAYTRPFEQQRVAVVHIDPDVSGANVDNHIAHELAHLMLWDLHQLFGETAAKAGPGGQAIIDRMDVMIERICNQVAHALTGVPFIPVGKKAKRLYAPFVDQNVLSMKQGALND